MPYRRRGECRATCVTQSGPKRNDHGNDAGCSTMHPLSGSSRTAQNHGRERGGCSKALPHRFMRERIELSMRTIAYYLLVVLRRCSSRSINLLPEHTHTRVLRLLGSSSSISPRPALEGTVRQFIAQNRQRVTQRFRRHHHQRTIYPRSA